MTGKLCGGGNRGAGAVATSLGLIRCETPPVSLPGCNRGSPQGLPNFK